MTQQIISPLNAETGAHLIEAAGSPEFGTRLLDAAHATAQVDELFGYLVLDGAEPEVIASASRLEGAAGRVEEYVRRFYQHDPAVHEIRRFNVGESFVQRISLSSIIPHDYRRLCFTQPGFSEKLSFGWRGEGYLLVISFYRREQGEGSGDEQALARLANLANLTLAVMVRRHAPIGEDDAVDVLARRLARSWPLLSPREQQTCARTIAGWTAEQIAQELGVGAGSVLTYRRRAYQKCNVSSAAELLPPLLS